MRIRIGVMDMSGPGSKIDQSWSHSTRFQTNFTPNHSVMTGFYFPYNRFSIDGEGRTGRPFRMINQDEFSALAKLARLDPEDESLAGLREDFNKILDFVNKIQELHAEGDADAPVPENEVHNVTRKDQPINGLGLSDLAEFAPEWEAGHFVVPGVLDQEH